MSDLTALPNLQQPLITGGCIFVYKYVLGTCILVFYHSCILTYYSCILNILVDLDVNLLYFLNFNNNFLLPKVSRIQPERGERRRVRVLVDRVAKRRQPDDRKLRNHVVQPVSGGRGRGRHHESRFGSKIAVRPRLGNDFRRLRIPVHLDFRPEKLAVHKPGRHRVRLQSPGRIMAWTQFHKYSYLLAQFYATLVLSNLAR